MRWLHRLLDIQSRLTMYQSQSRSQRSRTEGVLGTGLCLSLQHKRKTCSRNLQLLGKGAITGLLSADHPRLSRSSHVSVHANLAAIVTRQGYPVAATSCLLANHPCTASCHGRNLELPHAVNLSRAHADGSVMACHMDAFLCRFGGRCSSHGHALTSSLQEIAAHAGVGRLGPETQSWPSSSYWRDRDRLERRLCDGRNPCISLPKTHAHVAHKRHRQQKVIPTCRSKAAASPIHGYYVLK
jgi:hypothetical protein